ncbi:MAG TPA: succinate dehydrogenase assembly factor 2 [Gammaproteobacteria bacterium]
MGSRAEESVAAEHAEAARVRWRCRRGMRELDSILLPFFDAEFARLPDADKARFAALLDLPDPELHAYLLRRHAPTDPELDRLLERIRASVRPHA